MCKGRGRKPGDVVSFEAGHIAPRMLVQVFILAESIYLAQRTARARNRPRVHIHPITISVNEAINTF